LIQSDHTEPLADSLPVAARRMGVSVPHVYRLAQKGKLKIIKLGSRSLVTRAEQRRVLGEATTADAA
jgi:excisionase family DNA binding protein